MIPWSGEIHVLFGWDFEYGHNNSLGNNIVLVLREKNKGLGEGVAYQLRRNQWIEYRSAQADHL